MKNAIIALGIMSLLTGCTQLQPGEVGVKTNFGKISGDPIGPGMTFLGPGDQIHKYSTKQITTETQETKPMTADQQIVMFQYKVMYKLPAEKVKTFYQGYQGDPFDSLVAPRVLDAFRSIVGRTKSNQINDNIDSIRGQITQEVQKSVGDMVQIVDIPIAHFELPEAMQAAITSKQQAETAVLTKQNELKGAQIDAEKTLVAARAEAGSIELKNKALEKSPNLPEYIKANTWDGHLPTTVVTGSSGTLFQLK